MSNELTLSLSSKIVESENFQQRFSAIQVYAAQKRLSIKRKKFNPSDIQWLLLQGSALALSDELKHRVISQKINALLHESYPTNQALSYAVQILSSRIGNFPVISNAFNVFGQNNLLKELGSTDQPEKLVDIETLGSLWGEEQKARFRIKDKTYYFNLYQKEVLIALETKALISFSAPTSFGKSFIVRHHIARQYANQSIKKSLIIVPTKSLIDDFYDSIIKLKDELNLDFGVYTHARSVLDVATNAIFILTQERLTFLITKNPEFVKAFEIVYCDEAHYISRGYRGFVLRSALIQVIELCGIKGINGNTQYIFSSPLIKNPNYFKGNFFSKLIETNYFHKEIKYSPVEKNVHFIAKEKAANCYYLLRDELKGETFEDRLVLLEKIEINNSANALSEIPPPIYNDVQIVLSLKLDSQTILYSPSPMKAYQYAYALAEEREDLKLLNDTELKDLKNYIRDHYHETFGLIDFVKKGIGLHYGKMPTGLRRTIVELFERGVIRYLICTSTLLEGVNLPAKNIFLFSDLQGGQKHNTLSFWNLIGRAGRLSYGLSGNVFCVSDTPSLYKELFENKETEIRDPEDDIADNATRKKYVIRSFIKPNERFKYIRANNRNDIEYLIYEILLSENPQTIIDRFKLKQHQEQELLAGINSEKSGLSIDFDLLRKNPGIDPRCQDKLWKHANTLSTEKLLEIFSIISDPRTLKKNDLAKILTATAEILHWPIGNSKYDFIDPIAGRITQWLHEVSISQFIQQSLQYHEDKSPLQKTDIALKIVDKMDKELSYNAPKYLKCLLDIYLHCAKSRKMRNSDKYLEGSEIFLYSIESGVCRPISRFLFELGVPRPIAIRAQELLKGELPKSLDLDYFNSSKVREILEKGLSHIAYAELCGYL